jgi:hypothetical protein
VLAVALRLFVDRADGGGHLGDGGVHGALLSYEDAEVRLNELPVFELGGFGVLIAAGEAVLDESDERREDEDGTGDDAGDGEDRDDGAVVGGWWPQHEPHE